MTLHRTAMATAAGLSLVLLAGTATAAGAAESSTVTRTAASQTDAAARQVAVVRTAVATKDARVRAGVASADAVPDVMAALRQSYDYGTAAFGWWCSTPTTMMAGAMVSGVNIAAAAQQWACAWVQPRSVPAGLRG